MLKKLLIATSLTLALPALAAPPKVAQKKPEETAPPAEVIAQKLNGLQRTQAQLREVTAMAPKALGNADQFRSVALRSADVAGNLLEQIEDVVEFGTKHAVPVERTSYQGLAGEALRSLKDERSKLVESKFAGTAQSAIETIDVEILALRTFAEPPEYRTDK